MTEEMENDIEMKIKEKNVLLNSLSKGNKAESEKISKTKLELDKLLYAYYKSLKYKYAVQTM
jgi:hypothetical protein